MKPHRLLILLSLLVLALSIAGTSAQPVKPGTFVSEGVYQALKSGSARILVVLDVPVSPNIAQTTSSIATAQNNVLSAMQSRLYTVNAQYSHLPALALTVAPEALPILLAQPGVKAINLDARRYLLDAESDALTEAPEVQVSGFTGAGIRVAVVDSGINNAHLSLSDDLFYQHCYRTENDCPEGDPTNGEDEVGHGTHVSGIITGGDGVAPDAEFAALKVFTTSDTSDTNILNALNDIVANDAEWQINIVNMSLGGSAYPDQASCDADNAAYVSAFAQLNALGIAVFVSTGNSGFIDAVGGPGCVTGAIGVGSVSDAEFTAFFSTCTENGEPDKVTCFSNTTSTQGDGELMDILAPGCEITSEWIGSPTAIETICGTSMASPTAAGIGALLLSYNNALTPLELEDLMETTGDPVVDYRNSVTYPRVNAYSAFAALAITLPTPGNLVATASSETQIDLTWDDVAGETNYEIQRSTDGLNWEALSEVAADVVTYSDMEAACGLVEYRVRAKDSVDSEFSAFSNVAGDTARDCPAAPTVLTATILAADSVQLDWVDNATDETGYMVERSANGEPWVEIATLPAGSVTYTDSGFVCGGYDYRVRADRSGDYSEYSNVVTVNPCAPANDLFANAEPVVDTSLDEEPNIQYATTSIDDPSPSCRFSGPAQGSNSVWYQITPAMDIGFSVDTLDSALDPDPGDLDDYNDTMIAIYTGTPGALTELECNDDAGEGYLSEITGFPMTAGTTYYVYVARWSNVPMTWDGILSVNFGFDEAPPVLMAVPGEGLLDLFWTGVDSASEYRVERKSIFDEDFAEIATVMAPDTSYQDVVAVCDIYLYRVRSYNGETMSYGFYSNVVTTQPNGCVLAPANDQFVNAETVSSFPSTDTELNVRYASVDDGDPLVTTMGDCTLGFPRKGTNSVWYQYTPASDGLLDIDTNGSISTGTSALDTMLAVFTGTYDNLTQLACDDESGTGSSSLLADVPVTGGTTYYILVARWSSTPTESTETKYVVNFDSTVTGGTEVPTTEATVEPTTEATAEPTTEPTATEPAGTELIENGGFEATDEARGIRASVLEPWVLKGGVADKIKCNKEGKVVANTGTCAFAFKGGAGENSKLQQSVDFSTLTLSVGDTLDLSAFLKATNSAAAGKVKLRVIYTDETATGKATINITQNTAYTEVAGSYVLESTAVDKIKVQFQHRSAAGKVFVDDVSLLYTKGAASGLNSRTIPLP